MIKTSNLKKTFIIFIFLYFYLYFINSQVRVVFTYKDINNTTRILEYAVVPINYESIKISPFDAIMELDQDQKHKLLLSSLEKSRLTSLLFVGDSYEFNNVEIKLNNKGDNQENIYQILDKLSGFSVTFSLGDYDNIILHSAINFQDKEFNIIDKIASSLAVKSLLKKMTGTISKEVESIDERKIKNTEILASYEEFINQLKYLNKEEIFSQLKNYVNLNIRLTGKTGITSEWMHPANLYFYKKGDYKSIAFFYYYTLKRLGFNVAAYIVSDLIKKDKDEVENLYKLFSKKYKNNEDLAKIQNIESNYKYVDSSYILKYQPYEKEYSRPSNVYFYLPPDFKNSIYLVAIEINNKWLYTTGDKWIDANITTSDRTCAHYSKNGCFYSYIDKDIIFLNNLPFTEKDITWKIFYDVK